MKVAGIHYKPGPDAQERLRLLFTFLVRLVDDEMPQIGTGSAPDDGKYEED